MTKVVEWLLGKSERSKKQMTKNVKVPPNSTVLDINTVNSLGYLYQGLNQSFIYIAKVRAGGEARAFTCLSADPIWRTPGQGSLRQSITVHLGTLPAFPGRMDLPSSGLPFQSVAAAHPCIPGSSFPTPSRSHLSQAVAMALECFPRMTLGGQHPQATPSLAQR